MATTRAMMEELEELPSSTKGYPSVYDPSPYLNGPRHEYLNVCVPDVNPRILSRTMDRAMNRCDPCLRHCEPPILVLQEATPNVYAPELESTKAAEVFGRRVLPNLRKDLDHDDPDEVRRAIMAISDIVHDSKKVCEAVRVSLVEKLVELMKHNDPTIRERCCAVMETMSSRVIGRDALVGDPGCLKALKETLYDPVPAVRFRAAAALRTLARFRLGSYDLDEADIAPCLVRVLRWETERKILGILTSTLRLLLTLDRTRELCIADDAFVALSAMIMQRRTPETTGGALECLSLLASCTLGKQVADERCTLSMPEVPELLTCNNFYVKGRAAMMVMSMTHTTKGKKLAYEAMLLDPLLELAKHPKNRRAQLCSLQTLTNLTEYAPCRSYLLAQEDMLVKLEVVDADAENIRKRLLEALHWHP